MSEDKGATVMICDCSENKKDCLTKFREVLTDVEGICLECGHYAMTFRASDIKYKRGNISPQETLNGMFGHVAQEALAKKAPRGIVGMSYDILEGENYGEGEGVLDVE